MEVRMRGYLRGLTFVVIPALAITGVTVYRSMAVKAAAPYYYGCTPIAPPQNSGGNSQSWVAVYNPNAVNATIFRKLLNAAGSNRSTLANPANGGGTNFPGEANGTTITLNAATTKTINWLQPAGDPTAVTPPADFIVAVKVYSDQPIVVAAGNSIAAAVPCELIVP